MAAESLVTIVVNTTIVAVVCSMNLPNVIRTLSDAMKRIGTCVTFKLVHQNGVTFIIT